MTLKRWNTVTRKTQASEIMMKLDLRSFELSISD